MDEDIQQIEKILVLARKFNVEKMEFKGLKFELRPDYSSVEGVEESPPSPEEEWG